MNPSYFKPMSPQEVGLLKEDFAGGSAFPAALF